MLPAGSGRALLLEACVQCHDLEPVTAQRKNVVAWRRTVNEMIWRGAPLLPGEADVLTRYLAASFGPVAATARRAPGTVTPRPPRAVDTGVAPPADAAARSLPPGPGRALVLRACVGCHDLATTITQRKTMAEWRRSVDLMVRLGARLEAAEITSVADYLAAFLGPTSRGEDGRRP
jgi:mono/diheme cytochrome c family protein